MKRSLIFAAALLAASPAMAFVKVTNLSGKPQSVSYTSAGTTETQAIAPDRTVIFMVSEGMIGLSDPAAIAKAEHAKPGVLSEALGGLTANTRATKIPAREGDSFVIWPDGRLLLQRRIQIRGNSF